MSDPAAPETAVTSEEDAIQGFLAPLAEGMPGAYGLRDDCASIAPPAGMEFVVKTDPIRSGVHFLPDDTPGDIGWKALAVNVSDLIAKGATPVAYLLALSFPQAPSRQWMAKLAEGLRDAQVAFGCRLIGGDTDRAPGPVSLCVTVMGTVPVGRMVRRGAAQPGDKIFVVGSLGDASLGLALRAGKGPAAALGLSDAEQSALIASYTRPRPDPSRAASILSLARAAMDISDGLAKDLGRMCTASGTGAWIDAGRIPFSTSVRSALARDPALLASLLSHGDDYVPLVTVAPEKAGAFATAVSPSAPLRPVGEIVDGDAVVIRDFDGRPISFARTGWDHF